MLTLSDLSSPGISEATSMEGLLRVEATSMGTPIQVQWGAEPPVVLFLVLLGRLPALLVLLVLPVLLGPASGATGAASAVSGMGFVFTAVIIGKPSRACFLLNCSLGDTPPVDNLAFCLVRAIVR
jgi:hypothetical protein